MEIKISTVYLVVLLLTAVFGVFVSFKNGWKSQRFLAAFLVLSCSLEYFITIMYANDDKINLNFLYKYYLFISVLFFYYYFRTTQEKLVVKVANCTLFFFCSVFTYSVYMNRFYINSYLIAAYSISVIIFALLWFYTKLQYPSIESIWDDPKYFIAIGALLLSVFYVLQSIPRYLFYQYDNQLLEISFNLFLCIATFYYLLFFIAEYKYLIRKPEKKQVENTQEI